MRQDSMLLGAYLIEKYRELNEAGKEYIEEQLDFALGRWKYTD